MVIGSLSVNIVANLEKFTKGLSTARTHLTSFASSMSGIASVIAGAFSVSALKGAVDELDRLGDAATKLGIRSEALQGLERLASLSGVGSSGLGAGLEKMAVSISKGSKAFQRLNLDVAALKSLAPQEQFFAIAEAVQKISSNSDRLAAVREIFGKGSGGLLPTLMTADIKQQVEQFGNATNAQTAAAGAAADALDKFKFAIQDVTQTLAITLLPAITAVANAINPKSAAAALTGTGRNKYTDYYDKLFAALPDEQFRAMQGELNRNKGSWFERRGAAKILNKYGVNTYGIPGTIGSSVDLQALETSLLTRNTAITNAIAQKHKDLGISAGPAAPVAPPGLSVDDAKMRQWVVNSGFFQSIGKAIGEGSLFSSATAATTTAAVAVAKRLGPLEMLTGGTREAYIAARENMRPKIEEPIKKTERNTQEAVKELKGIKSGIEKLIDNVGGFIGLPIGG